MRSLEVFDSDPGDYCSTLLLAGELNAAGLLDVTAPFDGSLIAQVETCGPAHVHHALHVADRQVRDRRRRLSPYERVGILERTARLMSKQHALLAMLIAKESGKPFSDAQIEVTGAIDTLRQAVAELKTTVHHAHTMKSQQGNKRRYTFSMQEPSGVVVAVCGFSHPLNLVVVQVSAALAAGCPVIVKPSQNTPLSCLQFVRLLHRAGLAREWAQVIVTSDYAVAQMLATDQRVALFSFIGSSTIGWRLRSKLAPGTRSLLAQGGMAPVILAPDGDHDAAVRAVLQGGFNHAGQSGFASQQVFVPSQQAVQFANTVADKAGALRLGDPCDGRTQVGPLILPSAVKRTHEWVTAAVKAGAACLTGGIPQGQRLYPCTVLFEPPPDASISYKAVSGPVVCIYGYEDFDAAIDRVNRLPRGFQAAVYTRSLDTATESFERLDASAVRFNDAATAAQTPLVWYREAGSGARGIAAAVSSMQIEKQMLLNVEGF